MKVTIVNVSYNLKHNNIKSSNVNWNNVSDKGIKSNINEAVDAPENVH